MTPRPQLRHELEWLVQGMLVSDSGRSSVVTARSAVRQAVRERVRDFTHDQAREAAESASRLAAQLEESANKQPRGIKRTELLQRANIALVVADELRKFA